MSRRDEAGWGYTKLLLCTVLGIGFVAMPAAAGGKGKKAGSEDLTTTTTSETTYYRVAGTSDPTNVPLVGSDLEATALSSLSMPPEQQVFATEAWPMTTGRGVVVAVLDGGFNLRHPAIAGNLSPAAFDAIEGTEAFAEAALLDCDDTVTDLGNGHDDDGDGLIDEGVGHGTFVAGMVLKIAPDATILPIRVRDDEGYGLDEWVIRGVAHAVDQHVDVINLSIEPGDAWGPGLADMLRKAVDEGILIVLSAGNDGRNAVNDMAWTVPALLVGAVDETDRIADFSNYYELKPGDWPALMTFAPGVDLYGPMGTPCDDSYGIWSGTSFAAPLVSGAAALVRELRPDLGPLEIRDRLWSTTDRVVKPNGRRLRYGGRINVGEAVAR